MYEIIKNVINYGEYDLSDIINKINVFWVQNNITEEQKIELTEMARKKANPQNSYATTEEQLKKIYEKIQELELKVIALENGETISPITKEEYPLYVQPTGAHDAYNNNDKITYNGLHYICKVDGCVWSPDIYPSGWEVTL